MNDSILRGFCQKCEWPIFLSSTNEAYHATIVGESDFDESPCDKVEAYWVLSANQMKIILNSEIYKDFIKSNSDWRDSHLNHADKFINIFKHEPFLVAKILKESEKK